MILLGIHAPLVLSSETVVRKGDILLASLNSHFFADKESC